MTMQIESPAFPNRQDMPAKYTFDGENVSPPLRIAGVPDQTQSLALIVEDIDSPIGPFTHWVLWNIPPQTKEISENLVPSGAEVGINGFGEVRYGGPCPPTGRHRYKFRLYAVDIVFDETSPDRRDTIESEMEGHILAKATLTGMYQTSAEVKETWAE